MKGFIALACFWAAFAAQADNDFATTATQSLFQVTTDARPGMVCDLKVLLSDQNEMTGASYDCTGVKMQQPNRVFSMDELRKGVVIYHDDGHDLDVVSFAAPKLDSVHGGNVNVRYLFNAVTSDYKDWSMSLEPQGLNWLTYASEGHQAFNRMFLAKKVLLGSTVGIKEIRVNWASDQR